MYLLTETLLGAQASLLASAAFRCLISWCLLSTANQVVSVVSEESTGDLQSEEDDRPFSEVVTTVAAAELVLVVVMIVVSLGVIAIEWSPLLATSVEAKAEK